MQDTKEQQARNAIGAGLCEVLSPDLPESQDIDAILAALAEAGLVIEQGWQDIRTARKVMSPPIDAWLGDAELSDLSFYCAPGTRCSPGWHWNNGKWRPVSELPGLITPVQPTHWRPLPTPPRLALTSSGS